MGNPVKAVVSLVKNVANQVKFGPLTFDPWTFIIKLAITLAIQYAFQKISGRKKPSLPSPAFEVENETSKTMVRSPVANRTIMYGETMTSGPIVYASTSGTDNKFLHLVIPVSLTDNAYGIQSIDKIYLNDKTITLSSDLDGSNVVNTGTYDGKVRVKTHLGRSTQTADSDLVSDISDWGSNHIGKSIAYVYLRLEYNQDTFPTGIPNIRVQLKGAKVKDTRYTNFAANSVINTSTEVFTISSHGLSTGDGFIYNNNGNSNLGGLTSGTTYYVIKVNDNTFKLATTLANAEAGTAVNITSNPSETHRFQKISFSTNPALIIRHYLTSDYGLGLTDDEIDDTSFEASANTCDESVTNADSSTSSKYTCGGIVALNKTPMDIISQLLTSCVGTMVFEQGKYKLHAGATSSSVKTLTAANLRADIKVRTKPSKKELFNTVKGTFQDSANQYHSAEFESFTNASYKTADGGLTLTRDIELPFTTNRIEAQRIAKIHLNSARQGISVDLPCNMSAMEVAVGDIVALTFTDLGWSAKEFRVMEWGLSVDGGVDLRLQEEASSVWSWTAADDQKTTDAAPNTTLPSAFSVTAPDTIAVSDTMVEHYDGQIVPETTITIASTDPYSQFFELSYKLSTDSDYTILGEGRHTTFKTHKLKQGSAYNIRARAKNYVGVYSSYTSDPNESSTYTVIGEIAPPSDVENFACNIIGDKAYLSWDSITDLDLAYYEIRFSNETSGAEWFDSVTLIEKVSRPGTSAVVNARVGTYLIKAVDKMGNQSNNATLAVSTVASITGLNTVVTSTQHSAFTGNKTNCVVDIANTPDGLILDSSTLFDSKSGDFDDATLFFDSGGASGTVSSTGNYEFDAVVDLGGSYTSRLLPSITQGLIDRVNLFDSATEQFDDKAGNFDGNAASGCSSILYFAYSADNVTYSDFQKCLAGSDATFRYVKFRLDMTSLGDVSPIVTALSVQVDMPDKLVSEKDKSIGASGTAITFPSAFKISPAIGVTVQSGNTGDYFAISSVSATGFTVNIYASNGAGKTGTINYLARAY